ncbi:MAG: OprO/OprP family phosphate-selective porin [Phycisphaerae bacterium]|nr:OprO/OprP family phosphate-selective porin [Phycisphaerae bacterium]
MCVLRAAHLATLGAVIGLITGGVVSAAGGDHDDRLDRLAAEIRLLQDRAATRWVDDRRAAELRSLVVEVLDDADRRSHHLMSDATGGWDDEFFLAGADGLFSMTLSGQIQVRHVWNRRIRNIGSVTEDGFELRRTKLKLDGTIAGPDIGYTIGMAANDNGGAVVLQSYNMRFRLSDEWRLLLGRARPPLLREEQVSSKRQLLAERSLVSKAFGQTRTLGVTLRYRSDPWKVSIGAMDASDNFDDQSWRLSGRVERLLAGDWDALEDFTSFPDDEPAAMIGVAVLFQTSDFADPAATDVTNLRWSADLTLGAAGMNLFATIAGNHEDRDTSDRVDQYGVVVHAGRFVNDQWELFARYEWADADDVIPDLSVVTVGVNCYFDAHDSKLTFDVGYGVNEVDRFFSSTGAGWERDRPGQNGQVVVRSQLQLLF